MVAAPHIAMKGVVHVRELQGEYCSDMVERRGRRRGKGTGRREDKETGVRGGTEGEGRGPGIRDDERAPPCFLFSPYRAGASR